MQHAWSRRVLGMRGAILAAALVLGLGPAAAQEPYPSRPVTIVTPFAAGSVTDAAARLVAASLQNALGESVIVENKPGAGGLIAAAYVARAQPDGLTLLLTTNSTHSAAPGLFKIVPYDPIADFTPVARIGSFPSFIAVNPALPVKSMAELVAYARANPGKLSYGHGNSTGEIVGETLKHRLGLDIVRVAYRSNPTAVTDLVAGHIPLMIPDFNTGLPQLRDGKIRALAVLTRRRNPALADVPTLDETVMPGFDLLAWAGLFGPAHMPPEIVARLAAELQTILQSPGTRSHFAAAGTDVDWSGPAEFREFVKTELVKWTSLIKEAGIEPE